MQKQLPQGWALTNYNTVQDNWQFNYGVFGSFESHWKILIWYQQCSDWKLPTFSHVRTHSHNPAASSHLGFFYFFEKSYLSFEKSYTHKYKLRNVYWSVESGYVYIYMFHFPHTNSDFSKLIRLTKNYFFHKYFGHVVTSQV